MGANWIKRLFGRGRMYGELAEEIQAHIEEKAEELIAGGMTREDAAAAARRAFGNVLRVEERGREVWEWPRIEGFFGAVRFRRLARRGWFLPVEVTLLAVGIVAALLSLSAARASLSTSLRVPHPARTYFVGRGTDPIPDGNYEELVYWSGRRDIFSRIGAFATWGGLPVETQSRSLVVEGAWVTSSMIPFLPQRVDAGRLLVDSDFRSAGSGASNVLISEGLARRLGLRAAVGSVVQSVWGTYQIVGVFPAWARFPYPAQPDLIIAAPTSQRYATTLLAEVRAGVTRTQAERALNLASRETGPRAREPVRLVSIQASLDPGSAKVSRYGLALGLLTLFMLVATASLIELLDAIRRRREHSIKLVLGATPWRLTLERSLDVLAICVFATATAALFVALFRPWIARRWSSEWVTVPRMDAFALVWLGGLLFFCCLAVSMAPALVVRSSRFYSALKEERASTSPLVQRTRVVIVALQVAVSIAFGFGAARLAGQLHALATEPLGINVGNVWDGSIDLRPYWRGLGTAALKDLRKDPSKEQRQALALQEQLRAQMQSLPGVAEVGLASDGPAADIIRTGFPGIAPRGETPSPANSLSWVYRTSVDSNYLQMLDCRLLAGRYFTAADFLQPFGADNPAILSEPLARKLFGEANAVGREVVYGTPGPRQGSSKVVGVVSGMRTLGLTQPIPAEIFYPLTFVPEHLALKMEGSAGIPSAEVQQAVSTVMPGVPLEGFEPLRRRLDTELAVPRQRLGLLAFFAAISGAVAAFGLASVLLVIVKERDLEIGIRRALGASDRDLARALLMQLLPSVGIGLAVGFMLPALFPAPLGLAVVPGLATTVWSGVLALAATLALIAASLWVPLRRAFRRPINDLLRAE